ncbi:hypothetical protein HY994_05745 [Candidatus Micrarchaeota archaeon]|nr:hypothetical protein [Candidatus Micrarchaeota archaeon]
MVEKKDNKLWGGAFSKQPRADVIDYCAGFDAKSFAALDSFLLPYDLQVNEAHAEMLCGQGILTQRELSELKAALNEARKKGVSLEGFEDVHSAVEHFLTQRTPAGAKIHSGRSRNDQVATDTRLYLKDHAQRWVKDLAALIGQLERTAATHAKTAMPGYSHHRTAVPYTYGKWLQAYAEAFKRDVQAFQQWIELYDVCPLGACAGFGTHFPIAPAITAKKLGFAKPFSNTLDAVQQRGEAEAAYVFCIVRAMNHASQLAETFMVLSMPGMELFKLPEEFCTGSSVMPHKKNPDFLEATKAKASLAQASLLQLTDATKNAFTGYNRDSQWTKSALFRAQVECEPMPKLMADFICGVVPNNEKLAALCEPLDATARAEKLAMEKGIPFRLAKQEIEKQLKEADTKRKGTKI